MYCHADLSLGTKSRREKYITTSPSSGLLYQSLGADLNFYLSHLLFFLNNEATPFGVASSYKVKVCGALLSGLILI